MDEPLIDAKVYTWGKSVDPAADARKIGDKKYVLVKKGFRGKIKVIIQDLDEVVEISSYKTIKIKIDELSDDDLYDLIGYFTKRRLNKQVELLQKEIEFRKTLLTDPDAIRPDYLKNSLKIKYNIVKKVYKEKKYGSKKVKLPKKDFLFIYTTNRLLCDYVNKKLGISFKLVFNIINAKEYMKHLKKYENNDTYDEFKLFEEIEKELRSIIDGYLSSIQYKFSNQEDLLSDSEFNNKIKEKCLEYGIEIPTIKVVLSKEEILRQAGISNERIRIITSQELSGEDDLRLKKQSDYENEIFTLIDRLKELNVEITDDGALYGEAETIAREYGQIEGDEPIYIYSLNSNIINEICRCYTSPLKIR
jgi:hypothetical protein